MIENFFGRETAPPEHTRNRRGRPGLGGGEFGPSAAPEAESRNRHLPSQRPQLQAALQRINALLKRRSLLEGRIARLEQEVTQARRFACHDELTGLPNRRLLQDRYEQAVARGARQHKQIVLLFLDLDGFKRINDQLGHAVGDKMLIKVAARLRNCIRASDTACRYGGDEFVVLLPDLEHSKQAQSVAKKISARLAVPYAVEGTAMTMTTSFGMAVCPIDGSELVDLIKTADVAMYRNKAREPAMARVHV